MKYYNSHAHIFNMQYVPENFLRVQLNDRLANIVHWLLQQKVLSDIVLWTAKKLIRKGTSAKTIAFLMIGIKKTQDMVFEDLLKNYPAGDEVKCIILPIDFTYMGAGNLNISYEQQLQDLFEVKMKYPNQCFPFVAIDPRKGTATENRDFVKHYIEKGFSGIKLYPALGYFGFDERLWDVYTYAEQNKIPIMTHASTGGINYVGKIAPVDFVYPKAFYKIDEKKPYEFPQGEKKIADYCDQFNDPDNFREVLINFPELKICFAHIGLNAKNKIGKEKPDPNYPLFKWYETIKELMETYDNVYTDISYSVAYPGFFTWFLQLYNDFPPSLQDRILFGTDYFMTVMEEHGNDNEIFAESLRQLTPELFTKLALTNVERYLKIELKTAGS